MTTNNTGATATVQNRNMGSTAPGPGVAGWHCDDQCARYGATIANPSSGPVRMAAVMRNLAQLLGRMN